MSLKCLHWFFVLVFVRIKLKLFHRTSQPTGHLRERQNLIQSIWTADQLSPWFHSLHPKRFRTREEGWWILPVFSFHISFLVYIYISMYIKNNWIWHVGLQLEFLRKRYHKDILSSPVLMLNFCPDLLCEPLELQKVTRELLFLVDRSGSMSGTNIHSVKVSCNKDKTTNRS